MAETIGITLHNLNLDDQITYDKARILFGSYRRDGVPDLVAGLARGGKSASGLFSLISTRTVRRLKGELTRLLQLP